MLQKNTPGSFFGDQSGKDCCRLVHHICSWPMRLEKGDSEGRLVEIV